MTFEKQRLGGNVGARASILYEGGKVNRKREEDFGANFLARPRASLSSPACEYIGAN